MAKKYTNPPIIEAACEFRFDPSSPWDLTIPGLLYERIREAFPIRRQAKRVELAPAAAVEAPVAQLSMTDLTQFLRPDEKAVVQVGQNLLAVNQLKPYPGWEEFAPVIARALAAYREVASPSALHRLGLRYINRVEFPGPRTELQQYLRFRPFTGPDLSQDFSSFIIAIEFAHENARDILRVQAASTAPQRPDAVALLLDLDYFVAQPGQLPFEQTFDWLEVAHRRLEQAFEACITDRLRETFEEVKQ